MNHWNTSAESVLKSGPVVPVIVINHIEEAAPVAKALVAGGVKVFRSDTTYRLRY